MEEKKLVFICGFMGCGKTTQGKKLAKEMGYYFIDLDSYRHLKIMSVFLFFDHSEINIDGPSYPSLEYEDY